MKGSIAALVVLIAGSWAMAAGAAEPSTTSVKIQRTQPYTVPSYAPARPAATRPGRIEPPVPPSQAPVGAPNESGPESMKALIAKALAAKLRSGTNLPIPDAGLAQ